MFLTPERAGFQAGEAQRTWGVVSVRKALGGGGVSVRPMEGDQGPLGVPAILQLLGGGRHLHSDAATAHRQTVPDADRRRVYRSAGAGPS